MAAAETMEALTVKAVFERYIAAWTARDVERIAALHSVDSTYWMHNGEERVAGIDAIRASFTAIFERYPTFGFDVHRVLFGDRHWVLDWAMTAAFPGPDGKPIPIRVDMVDVVDINDKGEVLRKDTFIDGAQAKAEFAKLG